MQESWENVVGYEGQYIVSNFGQVISLRRGGRGNNPNTLLNPIVLKQSNNVDGYKTVTLSKDDKSRTTRVHIMVAQAFIPNPENLPVVNHIDGNKQNNRSDNLEWVTVEENVHHAIQIGLHDPSQIVHPKGSNSVLSKPVLQYSCSGNFIKKWGSMREVYDKLKCSHSALEDALHKPDHTAKGYLWKYCPDNDDFPLKITPPKLRYAPKVIEQYDLDGNHVQTWNSVNEIVNELEYQQSGISACCIGKSKTYKGYKWEYRYL